MKVSLPQKFIDGCHKYGWIITIAVYLITMGIAYGRLDQGQTDIKADVQILKSEIYDLGHATRGPVSDSNTQDYQKRKERAIGEEKKK